MFGALRKASSRGAAVVLLLTALCGCEWDKRLPFRENALDPALEGFWLGGTGCCDSAGVYSLIQFKREGDCNSRIWLECPFEAFGKVVRVKNEPVFTKKGYLYEMDVVDGFAHYLRAQPYTVRGDTLSMGCGQCRTKRYVRVVDTSKVDWAVRRVIKEKRKGLNHEE